MGLTLSLVAPTLSDSVSDLITDNNLSISLPVIKIDRFQKSQLTSESEATGPKTMQSKTADKTTDNNTTIKYLSKHGPPTVLGPTPGNVPSPNPIVGVPIIHPPKDTVISRELKKIGESDQLQKLSMINLLQLIS